MSHPPGSNNTENNSNLRQRSANVIQIFENMKSLHFVFLLIAMLLVFIGVVVSKSGGSGSDAGDDESSSRISLLQKLVIDTDSGTDDALALFYLLRAEKYSKGSPYNQEIKIMGITTVSGNIDVENVTLNVLRVLKTVNRLDIPVYKGASDSLVITPPKTYYFGYDGLGDVPDLDPASPSLVQSKHAVNALIEIVNNYPDEITLLALGPLTNIALACRLDGNFLKKLKSLVILGGSVEGKGNTIPGVEFNFYFDPEAVHIVINGTAANPDSISIVPWESVLKTNITKKWRKEVMGTMTSPEVKLLNVIEHIDTLSDEGFWQMADLVMVVGSLETEKVVGKIERYGITVVMNGPTRGGIAVDYSNIFNYENKIKIISDINSTAYAELILRHFN